MKKSKLKIAVTGGIGTGKSEVCRVFKEAGYKTLNADTISKEVLSSDKYVQSRIIKAFGEKAFIKGKPDKEFLSKIIFNDPAQLQKINSIIHPVVIKKILHQAKNELNKNNIVFVESALIFEAKREKMFDLILLVTSTSKNKIERVAARDGLSHSEIKKRMTNQMPEAEKRQKADFVLKNDGDIKELRIKARFFLKVFEKLLESN